MKKNYGSSFKFKVVMEVIRGDLTIAEVISKYQISKSVIHKWKKQFLENGAKVFNDKSSSDNDKDANVEKLHATIGRLTVERDFLQAAWQRTKR